MSNQPETDSWDFERLLQNVLIAIAAASAANYGFRDRPLLLEGIDQSDSNLDDLYRIAGVYSFACSLLERFCEETDQSPLNVLKDLGLKANLLIGSLPHPSLFKPRQENPDDPQNPPAGLEPV